MTKCILLVEDDGHSRSIYRTILEHSGYEVQEAGDGEAGIRMAREIRPDLILMDLSIPCVDGWQATRILKAAPETQQTPIVALTAHVLPSDRARAAEAGCDGYLAKPVEPHHVVEEAERWIGPAAGS
jgi:CheY-like chemotaxis protein